MAPALVAAADENHAGSDGYKRCAACHLAQGQGIPGAFPPLNGRIAKIAALPEGRDYLVHVVNSGLSGQISVSNVSYFGAMPAQGASFDAHGISDVLNYAIEVIDREHGVAGWEPYTAEEVQKLITVTPAVSAQTIVATRSTLAAQYPDLF